MSVTVQLGDSRALLAALDADSVDSVVTDPPYELTSDKKGGSGAASANPNSPAGRAMISTGGFMGAKWDATGIAHDVEFWREVFRVLKPGAHLAAFGGTRTFHRMAVAIENAGFEIRDQLAWVYGSGFPKSLDVSKAIDKATGAEREVVKAGTRSATRPVVEDQSGGKAYRLNGSANETAPATPEGAQWQGWGTALKPAWEPICLARKPLIGTVAANVLAHGTGGLNVDACRIVVEDEDYARNCSGDRGHAGTRSQADTGSTDIRSGGGLAAAGRFPANIVHDGSDEVLAAFPDSNGGGSISNRASPKTSGVYGAFAGEDEQWSGYADTGTAARFFYSAKAGKLDRLGSDHPTVKPVDLMRWLVRLITPPGGTLLDPFAGSGSTGVAAHIEGFDAILMELRAEAVADIERRLAYIKGEGRTTAIEAAKLKSPKAARKARGGDTPLFAEPEA